MPHPDPTFFFSAQKFQAYQDCPRRFRLQYQEQLRWPAVSQEPFLAHEALMERGRVFHSLIERDLAGIAQSAGGEDDELQTWWIHYEQDWKGNVPAERYPEQLLVGEIANTPLLAQYDVIVREPEGGWLIIDWKTGQRMSRKRLAERLQTRVYPYVLAQCGARFADGSAIDPASIRMVYWFAGAEEDRQEVFTYSAAQYAEDEALLSEHANAMLADPGLFPMTEDEKTCGLCRYRSYCGRGVAAGIAALDAMEDEEPALYQGGLDDLEAIAL